MLGRAARVLVTALLMFPQIAETIYSPALTDISAQFSVSAPQARKPSPSTLSVLPSAYCCGADSAIATVGVRLCWPDWAFMRWDV